MSLRRFVTCVCAALALWLVAGCDRSDSLSLTAETDEPAFRDGLQFKRQGRNQEALASFLKLIARRGDAAPESNLEAGLLYQQVIKDPLEAIHYFKKYLELQPNSTQAPLVTQRIEVAKREYAQRLPGHPLESVRDRDELNDQLTRLQRENDDLKAELTALRSGVTLPTVRTRAALDDDASANNASTGSPGVIGIQPRITLPRPAEAPAAADDSPVSRAPADDSAVVQLAPAPNPPARRTPAAAGRTHTVARGDTLYSLSMKYYGSRSRWRDIFEANRDQLPSQNSLKLGMVLKIP